MTEKDEKKDIENEELLQLEKDILNAKDNNELVKAMQRFNLWLNETSNRNIHTAPIKNAFDYTVADARRKHTINLKGNPGNRLKTVRQRIGYTTNESMFQDRIRKARKAGLNSKDVEFLKKMGLERLLDEN